MCVEFLKKYFSIGKTTLHRQEITGFTQHDGEQFHESWERFNDLLRTCPHHAIPKWQLVQSFYQGLVEPHRQLVDSSSGGIFLHKNVNDAWKLFENLSENSQHRASSLRHSRGAASSSSKQRGVYEVQPSNDLTHQVAVLTQTLKELITSGQHPLPVGHHRPTFQEACGICTSPMHYITDCPSASQYPEFVQEQVSAAQGFSRPDYDPFSPTYNAGRKDHPNFSWRTQNQSSPSSLQQRPHNQNGFNQPRPNYPSTFNQAASQRVPQPFQQAPPPSQAPQPQRSPNFDETMLQGMQTVLQKLQGLESTSQQCNSNTHSIAWLESQISELANAFSKREECKLPSQPVSNPRGQFQVDHQQAPNRYEEQAQAVIALRNGRVIETRPTEDIPKEQDAHSSSSRQKGKDKVLKEKGSTPLDTPTTSPTSHSTNFAVVPPVMPRVPFPAALNSPSPYSKKAAAMEDMIETFKQVKINLPLIEAIRQVPSYAKFLKDLCTQKRKSRTNVTQKVLLAEGVSSVFHTSTAPKLPDPGTPTISCIIGDLLIERALLDLGASVNLMPYSVYERFGLGELKPTSITLQLADRSVRIPRGVIEDVLVKVDHFFFPADFIVIDTEPGQISKQTTPVILGRPFLATANASINVRAGVMDVSFGNMNVKLNIYNPSRDPPSDADCFAVDVIDNNVVEDPCLCHALDFQLNK